MTLGPNIFVFILPALANKNTRLRLMTVHGNDLYGKIPTELQPIRTLRFILLLPCHIITSHILSGLALEIFRNKNYMRIGNVPIIYSEVSSVQIINQRTFYQGCLNLT